MDANNDGKLSEKELITFMRKRGRPDGQGRGNFARFLKMFNCQNVVLEFYYKLLVGNFFVTLLELYSFKD